MTADRKKKWLIVFGCFCINFTLLGIQRSSGVLYVAQMTQFGINREQAAWPVGVYSIIVSLVGPVASLLIHYWSLRCIVCLSTLLTSLSISLCYFAHDIAFVTFFYGAVPGVGIGVIITLTHVVINRHFHRKRATAAGLAYSGSCIGSFIFPPITEYFLEHYGLRGTFLLLGGVALHSLLGSLFYFSSKCKITEKPIDQSSYRDVVKKDSVAYIKAEAVSVKLKKTKLYEKFLSNEYFRILVDISVNPMFIIICVTFSVYFLVSATYLMIIVDFALDKYINENQAVFLISGYSSGDLSGRLISGWIADLKCVKRKYIVVIMMTSMGIIIAVLPFITTYWSLMVSSVCIGFTAGCIMINFSALMTEYLGVQKLPLAIGLATLAFGLLASVRPGLIGFFRDNTGTYDHLLYVFGIILIFSSGLWFLETYIQRHKLRNSKTLV